DRQHGVGGRRDAEGGAEVDDVPAGGIRAGEGGVAGDLVVQELPGVDHQAAGGQGDVAQAGVAGEGDDVGPGVRLGVAAEVVVVGNRGRVGAVAQAQGE